jgi:two-component system response regulator AtoC
MSLGKLLIVDDDKDLVNVLADRFRSQGYAVATGYDGDEALSLFKRERPDILLLDIRMPRLDGVAVLRSIRKVDPKVGIVIMSGDADSGQARMIIEDGACDFVVKPFDPEFLDLAVASHLLVRRGPHDDKSPLDSRAISRAAGRPGFGSPHA